VRKFLLLPREKLFFSELLYDAFSVAEYTASNGRMVDEMERIWKEAIVA
jgi:hypothetical protein